jgi:glutamyl-tRNA synthetase
MRADEFIASTPKFISLYEALEITPPVFVTLPPILAPEGNKKLGKRDGAKDILEYRKEGYLPSAMINFLAFLGWNPGGEKEVFTPEGIIEAFSIERIHSSGAMLQEEKLLWLNKEHIKLLSDEQKLSYIEKYMPEYDKEMLTRMLPSIVDRISVFGELTTAKQTEFGFILTPPKINPEALLYKDKPKEEAVRHLTQVQGFISNAKFASTEELKSLIFPYAEEQGKGDVLWPLRMSLTRQEKSMDPFSTLFVLGKSESQARIQEAINALSV